MGLKLCIYKRGISSDGRIENLYMYPVKRWGSFRDITDITRRPRFTEYECECGSIHTYDAVQNIWE